MNHSEQEKSYGKKREQEEGVPKIWDEDPVTIDEIEEAEEFIQNIIESGFCPVVTVPKQYEEELKKGLAPQTTWIPGVEVIAGTIARRPYLPKGEERIIVRIEGIPHKHVVPRFTGEDHKFHGIVVLKGPIAPESMKLIQ